MRGDWIDEQYDSLDDHAKDVLRVVYDLLDKAPSGTKLEFWLSNDFNIKLEKS